jgi:hypothetical protein
MTNDTTPIAPVTLSSSDITELSRRDRLRAELLLQLPPRFVDAVPDYEYDPEALAAWILAELAAEHELVDAEQTRAVEMSGAAGVISASAEFMTYLIQLAEVLKQGHSLAGLWDLARTIHGEASRLQQLVAQLLVHYPELQHLGDAAPKTGLVTSSD